MMNSQNGNDSILGKKYNQIRQKMVYERTAKKKKYESELKERINKKIRSMRKRKKVIPDKQCESVVIEGTFPRIRRPKKVFAFGSSLVGRSVGIRRHKTDQDNDLDFKRFKFRKEIGKKYLEELREFHNQKRINSARKRRVSSSRVSKSHNFPARANTLLSEANRKTNTSKIKRKIDFMKASDALSEDINANMAIIEKQTQQLKEIMTERSDFQSQGTINTGSIKKREKENTHPGVGQSSKRMGKKSIFQRKNETENDYIAEFKKSKTFNFARYKLTY